MTAKQSTDLIKLVQYATNLDLSIIVDSAVPLDTMMRQVAYQTICQVDCMTVQRLQTLLSEGMQVIMWAGYLGEELYPTLITDYLSTYGTYDYKFGQSFSSDSGLYHECFDLLDRHEEETPSGVIVDTLVAPHLALVIPQNNANNISALRRNCQQHDTQNSNALPSVRQGSQPL